MTDVQTTNPWLPEAAVEAATQVYARSIVEAEHGAPVGLVEVFDADQEAATDILTAALPFIQAGVRGWLEEKAEGFETQRDHYLTLREERALLESERLTAQHAITVGSTYREVIEWLCPVETPVEGTE